MLFKRQRERYTQDGEGQWWYQAPGHARKRVEPRRCPTCGLDFLVPDARQRTCSHSCSAKGMLAAKAPTTAATAAELLNSDNPRYTQDESGQWWYRPIGNGTHSRTRAHVATCEECGGQFLTNVFHRKKSVVCSHSCGGKRAKRARGDKYRGENATNWKGGRRIDHRGYALVWKPDHPSPRKVAGAYMFEHRLVMEEMLGRLLEPFEEVHHKNGVRDDNRPENLELWVKSQPGGQRARDLIEYAKWVLERYEPLALQGKLI